MADVLSRERYQHHYNSVEPKIKNRIESTQVSDQFTGVLSKKRKKGT